MKKSGVVEFRVGSSGSGEEVDPPDVIKVESTGATAALFTGTTVISDPPCPSWHYHSVVMMMDRSL